MKTLVVGGAGFIGSHLCDRLVDEGHSVLCLDSLITGSKNNIQHLIGLGHKRFQFYEKDSTKITRPELDGLLRDFNVDQIYYLASIASPEHYLKYPLETIDVNTVGLRLFLQYAQDKNIRLLYSSTSEVYGSPIIEIQSEDYNGNVSLTGNRAPYDEGKRLGEVLCYTYRRAGCDIKVVRIFNTFGPRMSQNDGRVIPNFINQILQNKPLTIYGDGRQTRSFCYISDMVNGLISMMDSCHLGPINLGNPTNNCNINALGLEIRKLMHSQCEFEYLSIPTDNDPVRRRPNIRLAQEKLSWKPIVGLTEGLENTIEYFQKHNK